jgi:predicted GNAT family N-acyltransferase
MVIELVEFGSALWHQAAALRVAVFVEEQGVPRDLEMDEYDVIATHFVAIDEGVVVGTLRVVRKQREGAVKIGRVAVANKFRGHGIGAAMMSMAISHFLSKGVKQFVLTAQVPVIGFYEKLGFVAEGEVFDEAGIPHRTMKLGAALDGCAGDRGNC